MQNQLFILHPENQAYVERPFQTPPVLPKPWHPLLILVLIALYIGVNGIFGLSIAHMYHENKLFEDSAQTIATITDKSTSRQSRNSTRYRVTYRYIVDDTSYSDTQTIGSTVYNQYRWGDQIQIFYPVTDPTYTRIVDVNGDHHVLLFSVMWLVIAGLGGYGIYSVIKRRSNLQLLAQEGRLAKGEIESIRQQTYKGNHSLIINVRLTSPNTYQVVKGKRSYPIKQLLPDPLPEKGTRLAIYYKDDQLWEVL